MTQIIRMNEHIINTDRIVWNLLIREDESPVVTLLYAESTGLVVNIHCSNFAQIEDMKKAALKEAKRNYTALISGEPISSAPIIQARKEG